MVRKQNEPDSLRTEAEAQLSHAPLTEAPPRSAEDLLHELRVYQIELEMQNDELRRAQLALEESRDRYVNLYEFAPVAYLTLTREGVIDEVNLTGAALLGVERKKLLQRHFSSFVIAENSDRWYLHFLNVLQREGHQSCELALRRGDGSRFHARLGCLHVKDGRVSSVRIAISDITERKLAEQQLRELSGHLQTVREEEKTNFAREIHDELGSTLAALKMDASWMSRKLPEEAGMLPLRECAKSMIELLDNAVIALRRIITDLRPTMLDDLGLLAALEWQSAQFHKRTGIECRVASSYNESKLDKTVAINLFRIFQESLTNVARHSGASLVEVEFQHGDENVALSISDNGCGLPEGHTVASTSYGILGMRERVEQFGGKIEFGNRLGGGLNVTIKLPLPAASQQMDRGKL